MPKYKVEHYEKKIRRHFDPLVEEQELLVKQYRTEATKRIVSKLSKKMGADKIMTAFKKAEEQMKKAQQDAKTFFKKKVKQDDKKTLTYGMKQSNEDISLKDCQDQLREWASDLAQREIEKRPEGLKLRQLKELKQKAKDVVMESGTPDALAIALDKVSQKIGLRWNQDLTALPNFKQ